ncbi:MAG: hypothetical protein WC460_05530 [Patescibacteria group bacterium]
MKLETKVLVIWFCASAIVLPLLRIFDKVSLNFSLLYFGLELWTLFILATIGDDEKLSLKKEIKSNLVKFLTSFAVFLAGLILILGLPSIEWFLWDATGLRFSGAMFLVSTIVTLYIIRIFSSLK